MRRLVHGVPDEESQFVRVLAHAGHPHAARPVVVEVAQLVGQHLDVLRLQPGGVVDHVVRRRVHGALGDALRNQEEVVPGKRKAGMLAARWRTRFDRFTGMLGSGRSRIWFLLNIAKFNRREYEYVPCDDSSSGGNQSVLTN